MEIKEEMHLASEVMFFPNSDYPVKAVPYARVLEILNNREGNQAGTTEEAVIR